MAFVGFVSVILPDDTHPFEINGDLGQVCNHRLVHGGSWAAETSAG